MRRARTSYTENAVIVDGTGANPDHAAPQRPLLNDFGLFLPTTDAFTSVLTGSDGAEAVSIQLLGATGPGLHVALTPASARSFAQGLLECAAEIEAGASAAAAAALRKAAGK